MALLDQLPNELPDIGMLTQLVHYEAMYDILVKRSLGEGYMTEQELVVGRYISAYVSMNYFIPGREEVVDEKDPLYQGVMINAQMSAATAFGVTNVRAEELYLRSQDIRAIQIKDFPREQFQWPGNRKDD